METVSNFFQDLMIDNNVVFSKSLSGNRLNQVNRL